MDLSNSCTNPYPNSTPAHTPMHLPSTAAFDALSQEELNDIQKRIRANEGAHAAFMLGQGLYHVFDMTAQTIRYTWNATTQILSEMYSSFKSTRANHFMNDEDFDYEVHQNINAETCVEGYEEQCEKGYPQAVVLGADYSRDRFGIEKFIIDYLAVENSLRNQIFLNTLAKKNAYITILSQMIKICVISLKKLTNLALFVFFIYLCMVMVLV